jgi:hypothetical protein
MSSAAPGMPTLRQLQELFEYDPDTGAMTWRVKRGRCTIGSPVNPADRVKIDGVAFRARWVAWVLGSGCEPRHASIAHVNGDRGDIRFANLRLRTAPEGQVDAVFAASAVQYRPSDGRLLRLPSGETAEIVRHDGYMMVNIGGGSFLAHRVVWLLVYRVWPSGVIDHINGNPSDNRIANLRDVTQQDNCQNQLGVRGACLLPNGKWKASIRSAGVTYNLGKFKSEAQARAAYLAAKRRLHVPTLLTGLQETER